MLRIIFLLLILIAGSVRSASAFWIWTPESGQWVNPKYSVKETPKDQLEFALTFYQAKEYDKATAELNKLIKHYPKAAETAEAQYYIGLIQEDQGQFYPAFKAYQVVVEKYPFSDRSAEIVKRQYDIGGKLMEGEDKRNKFVAAMTGGEYNVVDVFRTVIKNAPYGEFAAPSQYKIGLYLQGKKLYQEARDEFEKAVNDYPDSEWAKAAKYQIASSDARRSRGAQYDQAITKTAVDEFERFVERYPDAELSAKAQDEIDQLREKDAENNFLVAQFYEKQKKYRSAHVYYETIVRDFNDTSWAQKAADRIQYLTKKRLL